MTLNSASRGNLRAGDVLAALRAEYRRTFSTLVVETSRLQCLLELAAHDAAAIARAECRVERANRSYREARNQLAAEMLIRCTRNKQLAFHPASMKKAAASPVFAP